MVLAELLALLTAFLFGLQVTLVRRGLEESNFISAAVTLNLIGIAVFCSFSLLLIPLNSINLVGIIFFALSGLFAPGLAMLTYYKGVEILGASKNASIFGVYPLFSSLLAVLILGERPTIGIWAGIICTICGVILIERTVRGTPIKSANPTRIGFAFPLSAAIFNGFGYVLRKTGLNTYDEPIAAVAITYVVSLCLSIILATTVRRSISVSKKSLHLFWKPGLLLCAGFLCWFYALRFGDVSLVATLLNTESFFVFILTYVLLRKLEKITHKLVIGTLIIVTGISLISIF